MLKVILLAAIAAGCALHEGERYRVAGVLEVEGMAWPATCGVNTLAEVDQRRARDLARLEAAEPSCTAGNPLRHLYQAASECEIRQVEINRLHDFASRELRGCP